MFSISVYSTKSIGKTKTKKKKLMVKIVLKGYIYLDEKDGKLSAFIPHLDLRPAGGGGAGAGGGPSLPWNKKIDIRNPSNHEELTRN